MTDRIHELEHKIMALDSQIALYKELLNKSREAYVLYKQIISDQSSEYLRHLLKPDKELKRRFKEMLELLERELKEIEKEGKSYKAKVEELITERRYRDKEHKAMIHKRASHELQGGF